MKWRGWIREKWGPPSPESRTKLRGPASMEAVPVFPREEEASTSVRAERWCVNESQEAKSQRGLKAPSEPLLTHS